MLDQLFEKEIVDELQWRFLPDIGIPREIIAQAKCQLVECQEMDMKKGERLVTDEYLLQVLGQGSRRNDDRERGKGVEAFIGPNVLS